MDKSKAGRTPIALRVLKELVLPLAGGVAYGTLVAQAKQMPLDGVTAGGVAFFCILAAQGLVLRAARTAKGEQQPAPAAVSALAPEPLKLPAPEKAPEKEPEPAPALIAEPAVEPTLKPIVEPVAKPVDEPAPAPAPPPPPPAPPKPAPKPANDFVSIRVGIEELKEQGALPEPEPEKPEDGQRPLFRNLAHAPSKRTPVEALAPKQLLDLKMPYQAALNAAVNFERELKRQAGMEGDRTVPLESLFEDPRFNLSKDRLRQLDTLRRIRNNILHGFETLVDPTEAAALVAAFDRAATWFDPANVEPPEPAKAEDETPAKDEAEKPAEDEGEESPNTEAEEPAKEEVKAVVEDEEPASAEAEGPVKDDTEKPVADETLKPVEPVKEETEMPQEGEPEKSEEAEKKADAAPDSRVAEKTGSEKLPKI
jgi:outer membrane biosynthesis protein TonB